MALNFSIRTKIALGYTCVTALLLVIVLVALPAFRNTANKWTDVHDKAAEMAETKVIGARDLGAIRDRMQYNQELLESALRGIRTVADRLKHLREVREGLDIYTRDGRKAGVPQQRGHRLEKRA